MFIRHRGSMATVVALGALAWFAPSAYAGPYEEAPPSFDEMTMLRVALAYNMTPAYDLTFPARSDEACQIAGVGTIDHAGRDHIAWATTPEGHRLMEDSINEARLATGNDPVAFPCYWIRQSSVDSTFFPGVRKVWPATLRPNFNKLRKAMQRGDCREIEKRIAKYPQAGISAKRLRKAVTFSAGGKCKRAS